MRLVSIPPLCLGLIAVAAGCAWRIAPDAAGDARALAAALGAESEPLRGGPPLDPAHYEPLSTPAAATADYRIGPGDELDITVIGRPELSGLRRVGPDGAIAVPLAGRVQVGGSTRDDVAAICGEKLAPWFDPPPQVFVNVTHYENNKVYVLGRVEQPGIVELTGSGSLLQVLAECGGLPVREFRSFLARCTIIRGRDQVFEIDLLELLQGGNLALNIPLRNGDVVHVPDSEDTLVLVMGEVRSPGGVPIKVELNLVQALAQAGGPTEDADLSAVWLVRKEARDRPDGPVRIDFRELLETADFTANVRLRSGDIVYVARSGLGDMNYVLRKLQPALTSITLGAAFGNQ